jgi:hypothetical protein
VTVGVAIESSAFALWAGKQTARGTPVATADKLLRQTDGGFGINRAFGNEQYGDGARFSNAVDFTDTVVGGGEPVIQAQPGAGAWLVAQTLGTDTLTGAGPTYTHTLTPANAGGRWLTVWKKVGVAVGPVRQKHNDTRVSQLALTCGAGQKVLHLTPTFMSVDPGEVFTSDPVKTDDDASNATDYPFIWTEATALWNIDGGGAGAIADVNELNLTINDNLDAWYGDDIRPATIVPGRGVVTMSLTLGVTDQVLPKFNLVHYGTASPTAGTKPVKTIYSGSLDVTFTRGSAGTLRSWRLEVFKINYSPSDLNIEGAADGGALTIGLAGEARISGANPMVRLTAVNTDSAAY